MRNMSANTCEASLCCRRGRYEQTRQQTALSRCLATAGKTAVQLCKQEEPEQYSARCAALQAGSPTRWLLQRSGRLGTDAGRGLSDLRAKS